MAELLHRVEEVAFEAVKWFYCQCNPLPGGILRGGFVHLDATLDLIGGRPLAGELAERLVEGAGGNVAADRRRAIDEPLDVLERPVALGLVSRDGVAPTSRHHRNAC